MNGITAHITRPSALEGKIALITGGTAGIGFATALALSRAGAQVVVTYAHNSAAASAAVQKLGEKQALALRSDAGNIQDIEKLVKTIVDKYGRIDVLIANAGLSPIMDLESTTEERFVEAFNTNVKGPYFLVQRAVSFMPTGSHIILVSTSLCAASQVSPDKLLYCATKGAIEQMTRVLAKDLGRKEIAVNCIAPGPTATALFFKGKSEFVLEKIAGFSPYNRVGTPEETAEIFLFLSGSGSQWLTGQTLRVNGGSA